MTIFDRFFKDSEQEAEEELAAVRGRAREVLGIANHVYIRDLMAWLEDQADRPIVGHEPMEIVKAAVRGNTFREVRKKVLRDIQEARSVIAEDGER